MMGGFPGAGWDIMPMPILLALPSSPMAIMVLVVWWETFDATDSVG
jgi:hypothetical protein